MWRRDTILLLLVLIVTLLTSQGHAHLNNYTCPVSPLQVPVRPICAAASPLKDTLGLATQDRLKHATWEGPHACQDDYCIFSNAAISKHGLVVLATTPEAAENLAAQYNVSQLLDRPNQVDPPPYYVAELPGRGRGLVANRTIHAGEVVLAEDAILMLKLGLENRGTHLYDLILEHLPSTARDEFFSQAGDDSHSIMHRNGFTITDAVSDALGINNVGAFPQQALINHDCRPNLAYHFHGPTHVATAVRTIEPGEELTNSYIDASLPRAQRQSRLRAWSFTCTCKQCTDDPKSSDARLARITALQDAMDHPATSFPAGTLTTAASDELLALYRAERLDVYMGYAYRRAALNAALFGEEVRAREWAREAAEVLEWMGGASQKDLRNMRTLAAEPRAHWAWGRLIASGS